MNTNSFQNVELKKYNKFEKNFLFIKNESNLGCGLGHNVGYSFGILNDFEYIARIDNDMEFQKNFFDDNLNILDKNSEINAMSPKIMYYYEKNFIWWMGCKIGNSLKFQTHMRDYPYNLKDNPKLVGLKETDAVAGCASFMRTSRLRNLNLSDKDFFYGPEDVEFSRRIFSKKNSLIVNLDSKIYHKVTQSFKPHLTYRRIYFEYKYRLLLINKIGSHLDKFLGYSVSIIKYILYCFLFYIPKHRRKIRPVGKAIIDFFILNRLGEYDRKHNNH